MKGGWVPSTCAGLAVEASGDSLSGRTAQLLDARDRGGAEERRGVPKKFTAPRATGRDFVRERPLGLPREAS